MAERRKKRKKRKKTKRLKAIDVCSGVGGWACAARGLPIDIVLAVDLWDRACRTYRLNFPDTEVRCEDLRQKEVQKRIVRKCRGNTDIVLGGIPCQWLSVYRNIARGKKGDVKSEELVKERVTLDSVLAMVAEIDPRCWCLEDVKGLVAD